MNTLLLILGLFGIAVIAYGYGVTGGKRLAFKEINEHLDKRLEDIHEDMTKNESGNPYQRDLFELVMKHRTLNEYTSKLNVIESFQDLLVKHLLSEESIQNPYARILAFGVDEALKPVIQIGYDEWRYVEGHPDMKNIIARFDTINEELRERL